eukprot:jgi/Mesen1/7385/ME000382S06581
MDLFKKKPTPREAMRENKREMGAATRGIEREMQSLQAEAATRLLARDLVRLRAQITKMQGSRAQLRGVSTHAQSMHANLAVAGAMKGAGKVMGSMNAQMDPATTARIAHDFQKQAAQMDMTQDFMGSAVDDALDGDDVDEESEELTSQVLDEIGIDTAAQMQAAPTSRLAGKAKVSSAQGAGEASSSDVDDDLEKRFAALRSL